MRLVEFRLFYWGQRPLGLTWRDVRKSIYTSTFYLCQTNKCLVYADAVLDRAIIVKCTNQGVDYTTSCPSRSNAQPIPNLHGCIDLRQFITPRPYFFKPRTSARSLLFSSRNLESPVLLAGRAAGRLLPPAAGRDGRLEIGAIVVTQVPS